MVLKHYFFYILCILCVIHLYSLTPVQRGNIQELTKLIKRDQVTESEARARAQKLGIPANQMHDFIVQQLIEAAAEKGIPDIFMQQAPAETVKVAAPSQEPAKSAEKPTPPLPDAIRTLIEAYVNKEYNDAGAVLALRNKNFGHTTVNPYQGVSTQEALENLERVPFRWIKDAAFEWDIRNAIDVYYQLVLAKMRFKELNDIMAFQKINQTLVRLLAKNSSTTPLVFDFRNHNAQVPNKYFIELVDEFEQKNATSPIVAQSKVIPLLSEITAQQEAENLIKGGVSEFTKPISERTYKKPADFHAAVFEKIEQIKDPKVQKNLEQQFGDAYPTIMKLVREENLRKAGKADYKQ